MYGGGQIFPIYKDFNVGNVRQCYGINTCINDMCDILREPDAYWVGFSPQINHDYCPNTIINSSLIVDDAERNLFITSLFFYLFSCCGMIFLILLTYLDKNIGWCKLIFYLFGVISFILTISLQMNLQTNGDKKQDYIKIVNYFFQATWMILYFVNTFALFTMDRQKSYPSINPSEGYNINHKSYDNNNDTFGSSRIIFTTDFHYNDN